MTTFMCAEQPAVSRPPLVVTQGQYFRVSMPRGWRFVETTNGFEAHAPDGVTGAASAFLIGSPGRSNPRAFLEWVLGTLGHADWKIVSWESLPPEPAFMNFQWERGYAEMTFTYRGTPVRAGAIVGVANGFGQYAGTVMAAQTPVAQWTGNRAYLLRVAQSALITNPRQVAGLDTVQLPRNIPHDYVYGDFQKAYHARGIPMDKISQARREGTMGYEVMESRETGKRYEMPLEMYDGKIGGYRNPDRPNELLVRPKEFR